jgi:hypothetical protein
VELAIFATAIIFSFQLGVAVESWISLRGDDLGAIDEVVGV